MKAYFFYTGESYGDGTPALVVFSDSYIEASDYAACYLDIQESLPKVRARKVQRMQRTIDDLKKQLEDLT